MARIESMYHPTVSSGVEKNRTIPIQITNLPSEIGHAQKETEINTIIRRILEASFGVFQPRASSLGASKKSTSDMVQHRRLGFE